MNQIQLEFFKELNEENDEETDELVEPALVSDPKCLPNTLLSVLYSD
jgi:hypothetical protein